MKKIQGTFATALVYTDSIEESAATQIKELCNQPFTKGSRVRIMPDVHSGMGCVIGFTADLGELVIPNLVGVDVGCGMLTVELGCDPVDYSLLDLIIREKVPAGFNVAAQPLCDFPALEELLVYQKLTEVERIRCSLGTLGGGNHFIEVDEDDEGYFYLVVHTGSRNLGTQVASLYQKLAQKTLKTSAERNLQQELINRYKAEGREAEIEDALKALKKFLPAPNLPLSLCYLTGENRQAYLHDMRICQDFARLNRRTIANTILSALTGKSVDAYSSFETVHNYIDLETSIIRKGAVSAKLGEKLLIPINMRDGSLICVGKGNPEWNCSAPHGAGRLYSRSKARELFTVDEFERQMKDVYTTSVNAGTLDECPMAYKSMDDIVSNIAPTVDVLKIIRPRYNFKAGEEETPRRNFRKLR